MLEKPDCINSALYATKGKYGTDVTRLSVNTDGTPTWPSLDVSYDS